MLRVAVAVLCLWGAAAFADELRYIPAGSAWSYTVRRAGDLP
jgi:hypothetical protein